MFDYLPIDDPKPSDAFGFNGVTKPADMFGFLSAPSIAVGMHCGMYYYLLLMGGN